MRLKEIANREVRLPPSHPVLAVVEIDATAWHRFQQLADDAAGVRIVGHCPAARGRMTVYLGCGSDTIRQHLEEAWS